MILSKINLILLTLSFYISFLSPSLSKEIIIKSIHNDLGTPQVLFENSPIVSSINAFWAANWKYASPTTAFNHTGPETYGITGKSKNLSFTYNATVNTKNKSNIVWNYNFNFQKNHTNVIGGGIEFSFENSDLYHRLGEPKILPNNKGWLWGSKDGNYFELTASPPFKKVYNERNQPNRIRTFFFDKSIKKGKHSFTLSFKSSKNFSFQETFEYRAGKATPLSWKKQINYNKLPIDISFLNKSSLPAGSKGKLIAKGDKLFFEDGTEAKFWGTNLTAYSIFQNNRQQMREQAKRLSQLGFNLVRFHHMDSDWVKPNIFGKNQRKMDILSPQMLNKLDQWIHALKAEGIYVWLDLVVQNRKTTPEDNIWAYEEILSTSNKKGVPYIIGYNYLNLTIRNKIKAFNRAFLNHINPYTDLKYKDDPAIIAILITNENDLTQHFGNMFLPNKNRPKHNRLYMSEAKAFANRHNLSSNKTWQSWEMGPSKLFLNDLEHRFNKEIISSLKRDQVKPLITTTNFWGGMPISSLPSLTDGHLIDVHSYGGLGELDKNPYYNANFAHWIASGQVSNMPLSISEWNVERFPVADRHYTPMYISALSAFQGWDAPMLYAYSQENFKGQNPSNWHAYSDPSLLATLPAAALMYRNGHVKPAIKTAVLKPNRKTFINQRVSPKTSRAIRTFPEKHKFVVSLPKLKELPWLKSKGPLPKDAIIISNMNASAIRKTAREVTSDTGELTRNWRKGTYEINTPKTQAVMGWIGGKAIKLQDTTIKAKTPNSTIIIQSLTDSPIKSSDKLMISLAARSLPAPGKRKPMLSEPVEADIEIKAPQGMTIKYILGRSTNKILPHQYENGTYKFTIDKSVRAHWLTLEK